MTGYHVYRGDVADIAYDQYGSCMDLSDAVLSDTEFRDASLPPSGRAYFYVITGEDASSEGTMGDGTCGERSNLGRCM